MASPTVQLFYNRTSGGHCPRRLAALQAGFEARGAKVILSECGPAIRSRSASEASHVCAVGGDGTLRHVALALARCGRRAAAQRLSRRHRQPRSTASGPSRSIPDGHALRLLGEDGRRRSTRPRSTTPSSSPAPASARTAAPSPRSRFRSRRGSASSLTPRLRPDPVRLAPGRRSASPGTAATLVCEAFYVAKGRYFAGPWSFAPEASIAEPLLHVVALATARRRDFARFAFALWRGRPVDGAAGGDRLHLHRARRRSRTQPLPIQADGDPVGTLPAGIALHETPLSLC